MTSCLLREKLIYNFRTYKRIIQKTIINGQNNKICCSSALYLNKKNKKPDKNGFSKPVSYAGDIVKVLESSNKFQNLLNRAYCEDNIIELSSSGISVKELAAKIACTPTDIVKLLFMKGVILQINEEIDRSMVNMICETKGVEVRDPKKSTKFVYPGDKIQNEHDIEFMAARAPIVTIMGHVDHGKTSFLDYVRKSKVAAGESGGITQITSSYSVEIKNEKTNNNVNTLCFLDTPGHEAFSAMRSRGVKVTDIVIIIIAADDGVKPQTLESIQHAKDVFVPVVVAISKIDKKEADQQKVMSQLAEVELLPEEWGGQTTVVGISSKNGQGIPDLLENILLLADIKDLIANPFRPAIGIVLEAFLDNSRGPIVTVIIKTGTIRVGDSIQAGNTYGRVRTLRNEMGITIDKAFPSSFLTLLGLNSVPRAGQILEVFPSEIVARQRAESISTIERRKYNFTETSASINFDPRNEVAQTINIILKCDSIGSVEAIKSALAQLPKNKILIKYLVEATGDITESDVSIAAASKGAIFAFNMTPSEAILSSAKNNGVEIRTSKIIYDIIEDVRYVMESKLPPIFDRKLIGKAAVNAVFEGGNAGKVAGCLITSGYLRLGNSCVILRKNDIIHDAKLNSIRREKDQVKEVPMGKECGIDIDGFKEWEVGDLIECFETSVRRRTLEESN